mmetsp:Transcript_15592/g.48277  ORF Transcript_15592/g.48277 Transcript_15592/m.48277 type:complete len:216 (+) Transcript_15592:673-1320(+)
MSSTARVMEVTVARISSACGGPYSRWMPSDVTPASTTPCCRDALRTAPTVTPHGSAFLSLSCSGGHPRATTNASPSASRASMPRPLTAAERFAGVVTSETWKSPAAPGTKRSSETTASATHGRACQPRKVVTDTLGLSPSHLPSSSRVAPPSARKDASPHARACRRTASWYQCGGFPARISWKAPMVAEDVDCAKNSATCALCEIATVTLGASRR